MKTKIVAAVLAGLGVAGHANAQYVTRVEVTIPAMLKELKQKIDERGEDFVCNEVQKAYYSPNGYAGTEGYYVECDTGTYWVAVSWPNPLRPLIHKY